MMYERKMDDCLRGLVSIVIPTYNVECFIKKCLNSLMNQTYTNLEIIVVDDGSTDNTVELVKECMEVDFRVKLIEKGKTGVSDTRNIGIQEINGEYLICVDADDWIDKNAIEILVKKSIDYSADVVVFGMIEVHEENGKMESYPIVDIDTKIDREKIVEAIIYDNKKYGGGYTVNKFWRVARCYESFDSDLFSYEDKLWCICNYLMSNRIVMINDSLYYYRIRNDSLSNSTGINWERSENAILAYKKILDRVRSYQDLYRCALLKFTMVRLDYIGLCLKYRNYRWILDEKNSIRVPVSLWKCQDVDMNKKIRYVVIIIMFRIINLGISLKRMLCVGDR